MTAKLSIRDSGLQLEAKILPWDTDVFRFPVAQISELNITDQFRANTAFEALHQWIKTNGIKLISCRLAHDDLKSSFFLEQQGFQFIEMVLHPVIENLQEIQLPDFGFQVSEVKSSEVESIQNMAEQCFTHERFHVDPRLDTDLANLRYGRWVRNSIQSCSQVLLKVEDSDKIVAFFIVEKQKENDIYWHLTAVSPELQGCGYGRKAWQTMLAHHQAGGIKTVATTISARNSRVLNLYSQLQFRFAPPEMTFHWLS